MYFTSQKRPQIQIVMLIKRVDSFIFIFGETAIRYYFQVEKFINCLFFIENNFTRTLDLDEAKIILRRILNGNTEYPIYILSKQVCLG